MDTMLLDLTIKELMGRTKKYKLEAIKMLIDSIADDKVFEAIASMETDIEANARKITKIKGRVTSSHRADNKINVIT